MAPRGLGVKDLGRAGHEHALAPRHQAARELEAVEEQRGLVVLAVAVGVLQVFDAAAGLAAIVRAERVVAHLDDPQFAVRPPGERDRVLHQRLGRHEVHLKPRPRPQTAERLGRRLGAGRQVVVWSLAGGRPDPAEHGPKHDGERGPGKRHGRVPR